LASFIENPSSGVTGVVVDPGAATDGCLEKSDYLFLVIASESDDFF